MQVHSLKEHMKAKGFTDESLAKAVDLSHGTISRYKRNMARSINPEFAARICKVLELSLQEVHEFACLEETTE